MPLLKGTEPFARGEKDGINMLHENFFFFHADSHHIKTHLFFMQFQTGEAVRPSLLTFALQPAATWFLPSPNCLHQPAASEGETKHLHGATGILARPWRHITSSTVTSWLGVERRTFPTQGSAVPILLCYSCLWAAERKRMLYATSAVLWKEAQLHSVAASAA